MDLLFVNLTGMVSSLRELLLLERRHRPLLDCSVHLGVIDHVSLRLAIAHRGGPMTEIFARCRRARRQARLLPRGKGRRVVERVEGVW